MKIIRVERELAPEILREAAECVKGGGTLIFPTDTVYGIGCALEDEKAVGAIYAVKQRPADKPLAIHLAEPADAEQFASELTPAAQAVMRALWPGAVAVIVTRRPHRAAAAACDLPTISLRCPGDAACAAILRVTGPLAATSANRSGRPPYCGDPDSLAALPEATLAIVTGPTLHRRESTVLDCTRAGAVSILREGTIGRAAITAALTGAGVRVT